MWKVFGIEYRFTWRFFTLSGEWFSVFRCRNRVWQPTDCGLSKWVLLLHCFSKSLLRLSCFIYWNEQAFTRLVDPILGWFCNCRLFCQKKVICKNYCNNVTSVAFLGENGTENYSERRLVIAEKVNVDDNFYRDVIGLVDTLLYSHQVFEVALFSLSL